MKTDKLEKFVKDHRNEFDDLVPDPALWDRIEKREPERTSVNWTTVLLRVAAVVVIFVSGYIFIDYLTKSSDSQELAKNEAIDSEDENMARDLIEAEYYYTTRIDERREEFYCLTSNNTGLRDDINTELVDLDKTFNELKEDLKDNADNEEVILAMIRNYRLKLEILDEILKQLRSADKNNDCYESESINM
jgi:hypothetical protein